MGSKWTFGILTVLVLSWQLLIFNQRESLPSNHKMIACGGICDWQVPKFLYFLYYFDVFPVATNTKPLVYSQE